MYFIIISHHHLSAKVFLSFFSLPLPPPLLSYRNPLTIASKPASQPASQLVNSSYKPTSEDQPNATHYTYDFQRPRTTTSFFFVSPPSKSSITSPLNRLNPLPLSALLQLAAVFAFFSIYLLINLCIHSLFLKPDQDQTRPRHSHALIPPPPI